MKGFLAGCCLALLLSGVTIWAYEMLSVSSAGRYAEREVVHVDPASNPRLHQGPPPIETD